ncbi:MAG: class I SAM-dependent methyltransferase [Kiritimatiellia bacterium]
MHIDEQNKWEQYGRDRLLTRNRLLYPIHRAVLNVFLDYFGRMEVQRSVLDIGCGDGFWLGILRELGFDHIQGIDISATMISKCRAKCLNARHKSVYDISYNNEFDIVIANDVLEHLADISQALSIINRTLKDKGMFYATVPTCDSFQKRYHRLLGRATRLQQLQEWDSTHVHAWSVENVSKLLHKNGFAVQWTRHVYNPFPFVGRFSKMLYESLAKHTVAGRFGDLLTICCLKTH